MLVSGVCTSWEADARKLALARSTARSFSTSSSSAWYIRAWSKPRPMSAASGWISAASVAVHGRPGSLRSRHNTPCGRRVAERIIAAGRVPRALVCANDQTAIGVMAALQHAGLTVPGDVAVTGFDGIMLGRHLHPSLTTVVQPTAALGDTAVAMLTDRVGGPAPPRRTLQLPVRLELRGSCGCAQ